MTSSWGLALFCLLLGGLPVAAALLGRHLASRSWQLDEDVATTPVARLTRDEYGLSLVDVVKDRAACTRRQVGAVILDRNGRIAATGYNGTAAGEVHCTDGGCPRGAYTYEQVGPLLGNKGHAIPCVAKHAERNAIAWALEHDVHLPSSTLYISCPPCPDCDRLIKGVRVGRVVVAQPVPA